MPSDQTEHLSFIRVDGTQVNRYVRRSEVQSEHGVERRIELMLTPDEPFLPAPPDFEWRGCGVVVAGELLRWFGIDRSQREIAGSFIRIFDASWLARPLHRLQPWFPFLNRQDIEPGIFTTPGWLERGLRSIIDRDFGGSVLVYRQQVTDPPVLAATIEERLVAGFPVVLLAFGGAHWIVASGIRIMTDHEGMTKDTFLIVHNNGRYQEWPLPDLRPEFSWRKRVLSFIVRLAGARSWREGTIISFRSCGRTESRLHG